MAHIEQRPAGWRAQIRRKGAPSISRTFDLKADAEAWAREIEREYQRGNIAALRNDAGRVTIGEVGKLYLEKVVPKKKDHSAGTYAAKARDKFGAYFLANVRSIDVAAWRDDLLDEGYSPQTVIHHLNALSSLFGYAEREMSIALPSGNPVKAIAKPKQPKARDRRLRAGELDYLLRATDGARAVGVREIIILAVETSMRLGELLSLEWSRIDIEKPKGSAAFGTAHLPDTKNETSRTVALSSAAVAALQALPRRIDGKVFHWKPNHENGSFEKVWQRNLARARVLYRKDCENAAKKPDSAFLTDLRFHDLRHEATSRLFEKGLGVMDVASMTGHKTLEMLKRYTHIEAKKLAKKLG
ncbi:MAG: tyrosine-type recombinase/integrase [Thiomonas delicata]